MIGTFKEKNGILTMSHDIYRLAKKLLFISILLIISFQHDVF